MPIELHVLPAHDTGIGGDAGFRPGRLRRAANFAAR
jgi:hypothetical protein